MTLLIEDLGTGSELDQASRHDVVGGIGPVGLDLTSLGQGQGIVGSNTANAGIDSRGGVLNTNLALNLVINPQIGIQAGTVVDLDSVVEVTNILNSIV